jgi:hypothetical protein
MKINAFATEYPMGWSLIGGCLALILTVGGFITYDRLVAKPARIVAEQKAAEAQVRAYAEIAEAKQLTGPNGNRVILPLKLCECVAIAGEIVATEDLHKLYHWAPRDDGGVVVYRKVHERSPIGNPYYHFELLMERPQKYELLMEQLSK